MSKAASLILFISWSVVFFTDVVLLVKAKDECYTNADCYNDFRHLRITCCKNSRDSDRICQPYNCEGRYCFTDGDCGGEGECCLENKCIHSQSCPRCNSSSDCTALEYCCKRAQGNVCRRNCIGKRCYSNDECAGPGEYCDSANTCAKLSKTSTLTSTDIFKEIPKQISTQTQKQTTTVAQKLNISQRTDPLPAYAIIFIILFVILFPIQGFWLYLHCRKHLCQTRRQTQHDAERGTADTAREHDNRTRTDFPFPTRATSRLPSIPSCDNQTRHNQNTLLLAQRPPPPIPSYDSHTTHDQNTTRTTPQSPHQPALPALPSSRSHVYEYTEGRLVNAPSAIA